MKPLTRNLEEFRLPKLHVVEQLKRQVPLPGLCVSLLNRPSSRLLGPQQASMPVLPTLLKAPVQHDPLVVLSNPWLTPAVLQHRQQDALLP